MHRSRRGTDVETFILKEDDDDSETEKIQAYVQWPRGAVVQAMTKVKRAGRHRRQEAVLGHGRVSEPAFFDSRRRVCLERLGQNSSTAQSHDPDAEAGQSQKTLRQVHCNVRRRRNVVRISTGSCIVQ